MKEILKSTNLISIANQAIKDLPKLAVLSEDLYQYTDNFWQPMLDLEIGQHIYTLFSTHYSKGWTPQKARNVIEAVKFHPDIIKVEEFDNYPGKNLMNLQNGVLDLDNLKSPLLPHDSKYLFTSVIPVDYDPTNTDCPNFLNFLKDTFRNPNGSIDDGMCNTVITLGGYLIYPKVRVKKLFVFYGNGSNGKSILMDHIFSLFFNQRNVTDLSLNILANEDNTARGDLIISRINMCGEQKGGSIASDEIKKIVSGETISVKRHYKNSRKRFKPHTKVLVSGNDRIYLQDSTYGADRRLFPIDFLNKFVPKQEYLVAEKEYAKLELTPEQKRVFLGREELEMAEEFKTEAPAILNLFLRGLQELKENNWKFKRHASILAAEEAYKEVSDPTMMWLSSAFEESNNPVDVDFITLQAMFDTYIIWFGITFTQNKKRSPLSKHLLSKKIRDHFRIDSLRQNNQVGFNLRAK